MSIFFQENSDACSLKDDDHDSTLDQAPSLRSSSPSLADVSLQTGQSLFEDLPIQKKPVRLSKQTSTTQMTDPITIAASTESGQTQESIKVLKTTDGNHEVIEIATKNVPSQEFIREQGVNPEDIVVDMKYQDAQQSDSVTSELNIQHAAPQSFETVLVEPDDVTTEVVVDSDGTKRIIVRKLRRTLVTSRQTTQQHVSSLTAAVGDNPPVLQAFSEATMRGQQVTVSTTKPDGTIEMSTKQSFGGRVTTGAPGSEVNVEEYESVPHLTHSIIQGNIQDIEQPQALKEALNENVDYQTKTSTVHAVVQQVTRKVIRKTRRIIRKVTIIDGKETVTEEVIEEPEEVQIDEQDIPHISINVVKSEDHRSTDAKAETSAERGGVAERDASRTKDSLRGKDPLGAKEATKDPTEKSKVGTSKQEAGQKSSSEPCTPESPLQGPFFGPESREMTPEDFEKKSKKKKKKSSKGSAKDDPKQTAGPKVRADPKPTTHPKATTDSKSTGSSEESKSSKPDQPAREAKNVVPDPVGLEPELESKVKKEIVSDVSSDLRTPLEPGTSCKSQVAPVETVEKHSIEIESGTVELEEHIDGSTVESDDHYKTTVIPLEKQSIIPREIETDSLDGSEESRLPELVEGDHDLEQEPLKQPEGHEQDLEQSKDQKQLIYPEESKEPKQSEGLKPKDLEQSNDPAPSKGVEQLKDPEQSKGPEQPEDPKQSKSRKSSKGRKKSKDSKQRNELEQSSDPEKQKDSEQPKDQEQSPDPEKQDSKQSKAFMEEPKSSTSEDAEQLPEDSDHPRGSEEPKDCRELEQPAGLQSSDLKSDDRLDTAELETQSKSQSELEDLQRDRMKYTESFPLAETPKKKKAADDQEIALKPEYSSIQKVEIALSVQKDDEGPSVAVTTRVEKPEDSNYQIVKEAVDIELPVDSEKVKISNDKIIQTAFLEAEVEAASRKPDDSKVTEISSSKKMIDRSTSISEGKNEEKSQRKDDSTKISGEESISLTTTIAESVDINIPNSDSSVRETDPPQPDVAEITETSESVSLQDETFERDIGYEPDDRTTVEEIPIASDIDDDVGKRKRKKKRKQKVKIPKEEEVTEFPKSTTDDADFTDEIVPVEGESSKLPKKSRKRKRKKEDIPMKSSDEVVTEPTDDQLRPSESVPDNISISMQTSLDEVPQTLEHEIQTVKIDEVHSEMQTSPLIDQEIAVQTSPTEEPSPRHEMETTSMQTVSPEGVKTEDIVIQTTPTNEPVSTPVEVEEIDVQTIEIDVDSAEMQTSPKDTAEIETQTSVKTEINTEQQTSPEPVQEKIVQEMAMQTQTPEMVPTVEVDMQTSKPASPETKEMKDFDTQTSEIVVNTSETQTTPKESPRVVETQETEIQTIKEEAEMISQTSPDLLENTKQPDDRLMSQEETQTSPEPEKETSSTFIQTKTEELIPTVDDSVQADEVRPTSSVHQQTVIESIEITLLPEIEKDEKDYDDELQPVVITPGKTPESDDEREVDTETVIIEEGFGEILDIQEMDEGSSLEEQLRGVAPSPSLPRRFEETLQELPDKFRSIATGRSTSMSETESTDNSFEIQLQATLKMSEKHSPELSVNVSKSRRDKTDDDDSTQLDAEADKAVKKRRKQKRNKTVEIKKTSPEEGSSGQMQDIKVSYSDITKKSKGPEEPFGSHREISIDIVAEPMDTSEEQLSPTESILDSKVEPEKEITFTKAKVQQQSANPTALRNLSTKMMTKRMKNLPSPKQTSYLYNCMHIATLDPVSIEMRPEQQEKIWEKLGHLKVAVQVNDNPAMEHNLINIVETISTWLEIIEYKVFLKRECPNGPVHGDERNFLQLKDEVGQVKSSIEELDKIWKDVERNYHDEDLGRIGECVDALENQVKAIENVTNEGENFMTEELSRWDQFLNGVNNVCR